MLAMMLLSPEGGSGQHCLPPTQSNTSQPQGVYRLERKEGVNPVGPVSEEVQGQPFSLTPPLPAARLSVSKCKPPPFHCPCILILLSNTHLLGAYSGLDTGMQWEHTGSDPHQITRKVWKTVSPYPFPLQQS